ncbi:MAG: hypothetical protein M1429_04465, partial [Patescibacteria group bacterium]|nr:hypothetical protein [Patescibacteria group bacterium]
YPDDKFSSLIKSQAKMHDLGHAYIVFGDLDLTVFLEIYKIKTPDVLELFENPIKINHIRELISWMYLKPHSSSLKLAVLSGVENMTLEAANSLLKILEEPPAYAVLILQSSNKEKILPTILSRCQVVRQINKVNEASLSNFLESDKITQLSIKERFDYVAKIIEDENLPKIINSWEEEMRFKLLSGEDTREKLKSIIDTRRLLSTNTSVKLLLENLILKL